MSSAETYMYTIVLFWAFLACFLGEKATTMIGGGILGVALIGLCADALGLPFTFAAQIISMSGGAALVYTNSTFKKKGKEE